MPRAFYSSDKNDPIELTESENLIAVRTLSRRSLRAGPVLSRASKEIADARLVTEFREAGVEVYAVPTGYRSLEERKRSIRAADDVQFAGTALEDQAGQPVVYTENLFVKFRNDMPAADCIRVLRARGLTVKRQLDYASNAFFAEAPGSGQRVFDIAESLLDLDEVEYSHPELIKPRSRRAIFTQQWHLAPTTLENGQRIDAHANVAAAHAITLGQGVVIAVIDNGVDVDHPEFSQADKVVGSRDVAFPLDHPEGNNARPKDTEPTGPDNHGTCCAGVACASGLDGASGVAPGARLMPIRCTSGLGSIQEAEAFYWAAMNGADVISCSWGPADGLWNDRNDLRHFMRTQLPASTRLAIDYAYERGRAGKGCVVLFSAGNGNEPVELDGYAAYDRVIAVAACNDWGIKSVYSDFGPSIWCAFPSNDYADEAHGRPSPNTPGIWSTDRTSQKGYNPGGSLARGDRRGNYTADFGGTSSACPGAAGIVALMLSVNPSLTAREVKQLLKSACDKIDPESGAYDAYGHSPYYGYGRLNAVSALRVARSADPLSVTASRRFSLPLRDLRTAEAKLEVARDGVIASVEVDVELEHAFIGDLTVTLVPPPGQGLRPVVLHRRGGARGREIRKTYDVMNVPALMTLENALCRGTWTLKVEDHARADEGMLHTFGLRLQLVNAPELARNPSEPRGARALQALAPAVHYLERHAFDLRKLHRYSF